MNIAFTFRQMEATDAVRAYTTDKIDKLQKFVRNPIRGEVKISSEKRANTAEIDIHAGPQHFHAHDTQEDMYASIDSVIDKLERQMRTQHEARIKKGGDRASDHLLPDAGDE